MFSIKLALLYIYITFVFLNRRGNIRILHSLIHKFVTRTGTSGCRTRFRRFGVIYDRLAPKTWCNPREKNTPLATRGIQSGTLRTETSVSTDRPRPRLRRRKWRAMRNGSYDTRLWAVLFWVFFPWSSRAVLFKFSPFDHRTRPSVFAGQWRQNGCAREFPNLTDGGPWAPSDLS